MSKQKRLDNRLNDLFADMGQEDSQESGIGKTPSGWNWRSDANGYYTTCSQEVEELLGLEASSFIGELQTKYRLSPQSSKKLIAAIGDRKNPSINITLQYLNENNVLIPIHMHISRDVSESGDIIGWSGSSQTHEPNIQSPIQKLSKVKLPQSNLNTEASSSKLSQIFKSETIGFALEENETLSVSSTYSSAGKQSLKKLKTISYPSTPEIEAALAVPIRLTDDSTGILEIIDDSPGREWNQDEQFLVEEVTEQLSLAMESARLFEETQISLNRTEALYEVSRAAMAFEDERGLIQFVINKITDVLPSDRTEAVICDISNKEITHFLESNANPIPITQYTYDELMNGITGWCLLKRKPAIVPKGIIDFRDSESPQEMRRKSTDGSIIAVPMVYHNRVFGTLTAINSLEQPDFTQNDIDLLSAMSNQVAAALSNAYSFQQEQRRRRIAATLSEIARVISGSLEIKQVGERLLTQLVDIVDFNTASLQIIEGDKRNTIGSISKGGMRPKGDRPSSSRPISKDPLILSVVESKQPLLITETNTHPLWESSLETLQIRSWIAAPLLRGDVVTGLLILDQNTPNVYDEETVDLLTGIAAQAAVAIQNAQLFEQTRRQLSDLETISKSSQTLSSAPLETISVAEIIAHIFIELIGPLSTATISILDSETPNYMKTYVSLRKEGEETVVDELLDKWDFKLYDYPATAQVMKDIKPLVVQIDDPEANVKELEFMESENVKTLVIFPLASKQQSIGIIELEYHDKAYEVSDNELNLGLTLANQAAVALENARLYEEQRETTEQLREIDTLKSQFLANMSHELRTPLNSIIGFSRVIMKGIDGPITELQQQDLSAIYNAGQHLLNMINDILDISKIEAGKMELAFDDVELPDIIESVLSTARGLVKDKPVKLITAIEDNLPIITVDPTRIRQIFLNLLSNASKFTDEGSITVTARKQIRGDGKREIYLAVTDTGSGIDIQDQHKLFVPFSQIDGSPTRKVEGTGLGLSITRLLIELHDGDIGVISEMGKGSTFWFTLPLPDRIAQSEGDGKLTVMTIDDDPQVTGLYERYLDRAGFQIIQVTDPRGALEQARKNIPFAITIDIMYSDYDGWNLLRALKTDSIIGDIPVIICTILDERDKGIKSGAADYLTKPILEEDLVSTLNKLKFHPEIDES